MMSLNVCCMKVKMTVEQLFAVVDITLVGQKMAPVSGYNAEEVQRDHWIPSISFTQTPTAAS